MICSWLIYALFNDKIGIWEALIIGAALTPTDPVVAASVASGNLAEEYLPERLTSTISLESGANDGLAYPFVFLGIVFLQEDSTSDVKFSLITTLYHSLLNDVLLPGSRKVLR
jgi:NhaP-type Na+/H+ or K+/H+ antiporter